jgi:hypothetical protein
MPRLAPPCVELALWCNAASVAWFRPPTHQQRCQYSLMLPRAIVHPWATHGRRCDLRHLIERLSHPPGAGRFIHLTLPLRACHRHYWRSTLPHLCANHRRGPLLKLRVCTKSAFEGFGRDSCAVDLNGGRSKRPRHDVGLRTRDVFSLRIAMLYLCDVCAMYVGCCYAIQYMYCLL